MTASHEARAKVSMNVDVGRVTVHPAPMYRCSPAVGRRRAMSGPQPHRRQPGKFMDWKSVRVIRTPFCGGVPRNFVASQLSLQEALAMGQTGGVVPPVDRLHTLQGLMRRERLLGQDRGPATAALATRGALADLGPQASQASIGALWRVIEEPHADRQQHAMQALADLAEDEAQAREILAQMMQTAENPEMRQLTADLLGITEGLGPQRPKEHRELCGSGPSRVLGAAHGSTPFPPVGRGGVTDGASISW
jgi:hypothetical protein